MMSFAYDTGMVIFNLEPSPLTARFSYFLHRMRSSFDVIVDISRMASEPLPKLPAMAFETKLRFDWVSSSAYTMVSLSGLEADEIHTGTIIGQRICCELGFELVDCSHPGLWHIWLVGVVVTMWLFVVLVFMKRSWVCLFAFLTAAPV